MEKIFVGLLILAAIINAAPTSTDKVTSVIPNQADKMTGPTYLYYEGVRKGAATFKVTQNCDFISGS